MAARAGLTCEHSPGLVELNRQVRRQIPVPATCSCHTFEAQGDCTGRLPHSAATQLSPTGPRWAPMEHSLGRELPGYNPVPWCWRGPSAWALSAWVIQSCHTPWVPTRPRLTFLPQTCEWLASVPDLTSSSSPKALPNGVTRVESFRLQECRQIPRVSMPGTLFCWSQRILLSPAPPCSVLSPSQVHARSPLPQRDAGSFCSRVPILFACWCSQD